jgi:hypothetical protein
MGKDVNGYFFYFRQKDTSFLPYPAISPGYVRENKGDPAFYSVRRQMYSALYGS